jgi:hypothetical protein
MQCNYLEIKIKTVLATASLSGGRYFIYRKLHCRYIYCSLNNIFKHFYLLLVFTFFDVLYDEILSENLKDRYKGLGMCLVAW